LNELNNINGALKNQPSDVQSQPTLFTLVWFHSLSLNMLLFILM